MFVSSADLKREAVMLRARLEPAFSAETALGGIKGTVPSEGHCAAVAAIVLGTLGGSLVSATVHGQSHWFNRIRVGTELVDLDITGDQFGRPPIQVGPEGSVYRNSRLRDSSELNEDTLMRARLLAARAGLKAFDVSRIVVA